MWGQSEMKTSRLSVHLALIRALCVFAFVLCTQTFAATKHHKGEADSDIDVRNMQPEQVVSLFQNASNLKVKAKGPLTAGCNGKSGLESMCLFFADGVLEGSGPSWKSVQQDAALRNSLQVMPNAQLLTAITALVRGCALYATSPDTTLGGQTCTLLGRIFFIMGNKDAAIAVWESAPGCYAYWKGTQRDVCFHQAYSRLGPSYKPVLMRMAERSCNTLHWRETCEYLSEQGEKADMNAVVQADNERREARDDWEEEVHENVAKQEAEASRPSTLQTVLQAMPGATDPNAVLNAGNQQAAAIGAIGSANSARQQAQARQAAVAQRSVQTNTSYVPQQPLPAASSVSTGSRDSGPQQQSTLAAHYVSALPSSCIGQFWDPNYYNWLSFQNNCGQAIHLSWIAASQSDTFGMSAADLAPGATSNSGWNQAEVQRKAGFLFFVCPSSYVPVDVTTDQVVSRANQLFRCKQQ